MSGKTPRSSTKRTVSNKKTAAKKVTKKTAKRTTKKTVKKASAKTTKKVVKKATKKTTKKSTKAATQKSPQKDTKLTADKPLLSPLIPRIRTTVLALATYQSRVPIDPHTFMTTTARVSGVAFVLLGALFTALNSSYLPSLAPQTALLAQSQEDLSVFAEKEEFESISGKQINQQEIEAVPSVMPRLEISVPDLAEGKEKVQVEAYITEADGVSWYVRPRHSASKHFVATVSHQGNGVWRGVIDTSNLPTGTYELVAEATTPYGIVASTPSQITVNNQNTSASLTEMSGSAVHIENTSVSSRGERVETKVEETASVGQPPNLDQYNEQLNRLFNDLTSARQSGDSAAAESATQQLQKVQREMLQTSSVSNGEGKEQSVSTYIERLQAEHRERMEKQLRLISERQHADVRKDTDEDGVSDYDEVAFFATDPTRPDSDGDGTDDGAEIMAGLNPVSESGKMIYESPKEHGVERGDLLQVDGFEPLSEPVDEVTEELTTQASSTPERLVARASGRALPNSFVTLYIYSNPVVVTLKTDEYGNWEYIFDQEIADGEHTVYVGITDNAGRIVAKSEPFRFVKEAQAITPVAQAELDMQSGSNGESSLASQSLFLLIGSLSVVLIGLVLVLLGIFLEIRQPVKTRVEDV